MKRVLCAILGLAPLLLGCSKTDANPELSRSTGCSEIIVVPVTAHSISAADAAVATTLFARNGIDSRAFRYTRYLRESVQTYFPPYATFDSQVVGVMEYVNGLPVFTGLSNFSFKNGVFNFRAGGPTNAAYPDATPSSKASQLRGLFEATIAKYDPSQGISNLQCVTAEFGYYNVNAGKGMTAEDPVKAWRVTLKNQEYPFAYYEDKGGRLIYYDNGIRTFR
jgi:hypothetical protein